MTQTEPTRLNLPVYKIDYAEGTFTHTMTGENVVEIEGVVLDYSEDRVLWSDEDAAPLPVCVNGSNFGPCETCEYKDFVGGEPPLCSEEISLLVAQGPLLTVVTARRSMVRPVEQFINMLAMSATPLFAQKVTLSLRPQPPRPGEKSGLHRLAVLPGDLLSVDEQGRMRALRDVAREDFRRLHGTPNVPLA